MIKLKKLLNQISYITKDLKLCKFVNLKSLDPEKKDELHKQIFLEYNKSKMQFLVVYIKFLNFYLKTLTFP